MTTVREAQIEQMLSVESQAVRYKPTKAEWVLIAIGIIGLGSMTTLLALHGDVSGAALGGMVGLPTLVVGAGRPLYDISSDTIRRLRNNEGDRIIFSEEPDQPTI